MVEDGNDSYDVDCIDGSDAVEVANSVNHNHESLSNELLMSGAGD